MKLNDPFGRLESRHQKGYESMKASLKQAGIETPQAAESVLKQAWKRGAMVLGVGFLFLAAVAILIPKALPLALGLGFFLLVWVVSSNINGQRYIRRYIEEDLEAGQKDGS